jgi:hypothetical protein
MSARIWLGRGRRPGGGERELSIGVQDFAFWVPVPGKRALPGPLGM